MLPSSVPATADNQTHQRQRNDALMCSSSTPAAPAPAGHSFPPSSSTRTAPRLSQSDGRDGDGTADADCWTARAGAGTTPGTSVSAAPAQQQQQRPLLTFTAPLNDVAGRSGTSSASSSSCAYHRRRASCNDTSDDNDNTNNDTAGAGAPPPHPHPATTDGGSDALLDDLERWCHRQFGTAFPSTSAATAAATAASAADAASGGAGGSRKRQRRVGHNPAQLQEEARATHQLPPLPPLPPWPHSLSPSPSSLTTARRALVADPTSFSDLLQLLDAHELKEAIATGSVFDEDLAAQSSALPALAPYAADVWGDMDRLGTGMVGMGTGMTHDDLLLAGIGLGGEEGGEELKMPSSIAGSSVHGGGSGSGPSSSRNDDPQQSCAYEMMTSDVRLPAETRDELRMAYPSLSTVQLQQPACATVQQQQQQQQQQQLLFAGYPTTTTTTTTDAFPAQMMTTHPTLPTHSNHPPNYYHHVQPQPQPHPQPPPPPPTQTVASHQRFLESLEFSSQSERLLREWDRSMGLKACHSKTMLRTGKSRKKLLDKVGSVGAFLYLKRLSDDGTPGTGAGTGAYAYAGGYDQPGGAAGGGVGSHGSMVGSYLPGAYPSDAYAGGYATAAAACAAAEQKKKGGEVDGGAMGSNRSSSHDSFQDQIEKNSQTATMA